MARKLQLIGSALLGGLDPAKVKEMINEYLDENPPIARVTINGKEPDENGNFVIEVESVESHNVVEF